MKKGEKVTLKINKDLGVFTVWQVNGTTIKAIQESTGDMYEAAVWAWEELE